MNRILKKVLLVGVVSFSAYGFVATMQPSTTNVEQGGDPVVGLRVGDKAPELNYNDPNGKSIALSSLKGKVVLIDFWASWCGPCRMENPNVVRVYEKYRDTKFKNGKGFTVYGVSLDVDSKKWQGAIVKDKLNWPAHVSDLKGWSSAAGKTYRVSAIPTNFLIDGDGIILGKNLRGPALESALQQIALK